MNSDEFIDDLLKKNFIQVADTLNKKQTLQKIVALLKSLKKKGTKVISLVGGAGSGKSTLAQAIADVLSNTSVISTDDFVIGTRNYRKKFIEVDGKSPLLKYDFELLKKKVEKIKLLELGKKVSLPLYESHTGLGLKIEYDNCTGRIASIDKNTSSREIGKVDFLIVEGDFQILEEPDYQIFLHVSDEVRLRNRIKRDLNERGVTTVKKITANFNLRQKLQHKPYTLNYALNADLILVVCIKKNRSDEYFFSFWMHNF